MREPHSSPRSAPARPPPGSGPRPPVPSSPSGHAPSPPPRHARGADCGGDRDGGPVQGLPQGEGDQHLVPFAQVLGVDVDPGLLFLRRRGAGELDRRIALAQPPQGASPIQAGPLAEGDAGPGHRLPGLVGPVPAGCHAGAAGDGVHDVLHLALVARRQAQVVQAQVPLHGATRPQSSSLPTFIGRPMRALGSPAGPWPGSGPGAPPPAPWTAARRGPCPRRRWPGQPPPRRPRRGVSAP